KIYVFCRPGGDLLSRVLRRSTIGAGAFHGRVRKGNGCSRPAITTRSAKHITLRSCFCAFAQLTFAKLELRKADWPYFYPSARFSAFWAAIMSAGYQHRFSDEH